MKEIKEHENNHAYNQSEEVTHNDKQLAECQTQVAEWKDRALRITADFENFKKRSDKERLMWTQNAQSSLLLDLVSIVDDFDRAFAQPAEQSIEGFELIYKSLQKMLQKYSVQEIKDVTHFDPSKHEAIMQVESADHKSGDIVQVLEKGYLFKGEILRPAKVSVAK